MVGLQPQRFRARGWDRDQTRWLASQSALVSLISSSLISDFEEERDHCWAWVEARLAVKKISHEYFANTSMSELRAVCGVNNEATFEGESLSIPVVISGLIADGIWTLLPEDVLTRLQLSGRAFHGHLCDGLGEFPTRFTCHASHPGRRSSVPAPGVRCPEGSKRAAAVRGREPRKLLREATPMSDDAGANALSASLVRIAESQRELRVELGQNSCIDLGHLLAHHTETDAEFSPLPANVAEDAAELHARRIEYAGGLLDEDVDEGKLVGRADAPVSHVRKLMPRL